MDQERYQKVLDQLDEQADSVNLNFPAFGTAFYYVDSRLSAFANEDYWGILIEVIEVSGGGIGHPRNLNSVYRYGNCSCRPIGLKENRSFSLTSDGEDGATFDEKTEILKPDTKTTKIYSHIVPIPHDLNFYYKKGIDLIDKEICPRELLRALTPEYRDLFFLNEEQLQTEFVHPIPKILQLEEWRHPIYDEENIIELPSIYEAFQMIAKVIATCDPGYYKPTEEPNTHWKNWLIADEIF